MKTFYEKPTQVTFWVPNVGAEPTIENLILRAGIAYKDEIIDTEDGTVIKVHNVHDDMRDYSLRLYFALVRTKLLIAEYEWGTTEFKED